MVFAIEKENIVYLWWDNRKEFTKGCVYRVTLDNKSVVYVKDRLYNFKNMDMEIEHIFQIDLIDKDGLKIGPSEYYNTKKIFKKKTPLNVTLPPYNAVGDGVTDCSNAIQKAFADCSDNQYIYFPLGIYCCKKMVFNGDKKIVFDSGAILTKNDNGRGQC